MPAIPVIFPPGRGRLATRPVPTGSRVRHDDWDFARRLLRRLSGGREPSDDYIDFETDQLGGQFGKPVDLSFCRSKLKSNVLPFDVPQISQPLSKHSPKLFRIGIAKNQRADRRHLRLLRRATCARPPRCRERLPTPAVR
jgi:hypothetical protein